MINTKEVITLYGTFASIIIQGKSATDIAGSHMFFSPDMLNNNGLPLLLGFSEFKSEKRILYRLSDNNTINIDIPALSFIETFKYLQIKSIEIAFGTYPLEDILEDINKTIAVLYKYFTPITKEEYDNLAKQI